MSDTPAAPMPGDRLAKVMARVGLCSRRDAEEWIKAGRVTVNGRKVMTPAFNISSTDQVVDPGANAGAIGDRGPTTVTGPIATHAPRSR